MKQFKAIVIGLAMCLVLGAGVEAFASSQGMVKRQKKEAPAPKKEEKNPAPKKEEKKPAPAKPKPAPKAVPKEESKPAPMAASRARPDRPGKDEFGREYVDLGLPGGVLWATCNVGAGKPEEYGLYFAWGEIMGYAKGESHNFNWANYKWCKGTFTTMTKYCTFSSYGRVDNKTVLDAADDAATANWGAGWRMPTRKEHDALRNSSYCTWTWTTRNGVSGYEVKSKSNGNSIFLPAAGYRSGAGLYSEGSYGYYWSRELYTGRSDDAYGLYFNSSYIDWNGNRRYYGQSVRAVRVPSE